MFINNFDPVAFKFLSLEIRWYALAYIAGILLGWYLAKKFFVQKNIKEKFDDYITYVILGLILGGRLGYVIFYNLDYYLVNFFEIFKIWEGGMSFHGGLLGVILSVIIFARKRKINFFILSDIISCVSPIGIFFGRVANFINGELYGKFSSAPWAVIFPKVDGLTRHPSQIYEAILEGIFLFLLINYFALKKKLLFKPGYVSVFFLISYSIVRVFSEHYREPDIHIGLIFNYFSLGSLLSLVTIFLGIIIILFIKKNEQNN